MLKQSISNNVHKLLHTSALLNKIVKDARDTTALLFGVLSGN